MYVLLIPLETGYPREGTLIFSHIRRLGLFFGVQNSEFQYFFGFSEKKNIFWGYEDFVDIFLGHMITKFG